MTHALLITMATSVLIIISTLVVPSSTLSLRKFSPRTPVSGKVILQRSYRRLDDPKSNSVVPSGSSTLSNHPSNFQIVFLQSRTGYFLQIPKNGKIRGTATKRNKFTKIKMQSVGTSIVLLQGLYSRTYLAMDKNGIIYVTKNLTDECHFKETLERTDFHSFASHKYSGRNSANTTKEWYLAIKRNGKVKQAVNTTKRQRAVQFMVIAAKKYLR